MAGELLRQARRLVVFVIGTTVLLIGVALLVLPGPAFVVIPVGLAILATEFAWARRLLDRVKSAVESGVKKLRLRDLFGRKPDSTPGRRK
jgi:tellurite resistance protein TerC